jgi:hypothetical protein
MYMNATKALELLAERDGRDIWWRQPSGGRP